MKKKAKSQKIQETAQSAEKESVREPVAENGHAKKISKRESALVSRVQNRLENVLGLHRLKSFSATGVQKLFLGLLAGLMILSVVQIGLLVGNAGAISRYSEQSRAEWLATQLRAEMANRPLLNVQPESFICPDSAATQELMLGGIDKTVCTLTLSFANLSSVYAAEAALFEELIIVAEGREFELLKGIGHEVKAFVVQPNATTVVEVPFAVARAELGPQTEQNLVQIHVQLTHLAKERTPVAGEYWYRYHWQHSPRGFTLKSSESQIPEVDVSVLKP